MAHDLQQQFCVSVKEKFPAFFKEKLVLDIGCLDINGNNQSLFEDCGYLGLDIAPGRNVDIVSPGHALGMPDGTFDVIISTECFEHDMHYQATIINAIRMLKPGGLFVFSCATTGRPEHGTRRTTPDDAPFVHLFGDWGDYYKNLEESDFRQFLDFDAEFSSYEFSVQHVTHDIYFWGIKVGEFEKRNDYSFLLPNSPVPSLKARVEQLSADCQKALAKLSDDCEQAMKDKEEQLHEMRRQLSDKNDQINRLELELADCKGYLDFIFKSKSWRLTLPLRIGMGHVYKGVALARRAKNALRYVANGDFDGLRQRYRAIRLEQALQGVSDISTLDSGLRWGVMATPHTLFIAHLIAARLREHGWAVSIMATEPEVFDLDLYVVLCPQMFKTLPPGEKRIAFQLEQSVSSRWFTESYLKALNESLGVFEYALSNMDFLASKGIAYPHVYYMPIGALPDYRVDLREDVKLHDVLFYGDANSSPRRKAMLTELKKHFNVRVCSEIFGDDMLREIRRSRVVVNIHYYENALLEMPRIQECISLGIPVVSEAAADLGDYPEIQGAVTFFPEGNVQAMVAAVRAGLEQVQDETLVQDAARAGAVRFAFMLDRALMAMGLLPPSALEKISVDFSGVASRVALSMPETIARRRVFEANRPSDCAVFDAVRFRPGWVGCALSYVKLMQYGLKNKLERLMVLEDDVLLPDDFEEKLGVVNKYLDSCGECWDVFAGVIATLHPEVKILDVQEVDGLVFVSIDKMTSMVCNIYSRRAMNMISVWDSSDRNDQTNTIDKFIERQSSLRVVVTLPFLVGHREEVNSTLWGFQNTQYRDLIQASEDTLREKVNAYLIKKGAPRPVVMN